MNITTANEYALSPENIVEAVGGMLTEAVTANHRITAALPSELITDKWRALRVLSPNEVNRICDEEAHTQFIVEGLLPAKSIAIAAGDSTIGKSPLMYELGLCVAAGVPLLGRNTYQGRVLYCDLENSLHDSRTMRDALVRFLGLNVVPEDFLIATEPLDLDRVIAEVKPCLVIIDSLRAFAPEATKDNANAAKWLNPQRQRAREFGVCFLIVHHLRKPGDYSIPWLDDTTKVAEWMLEMEGPRAFVNQTDVRIALREGDFNPAALRMKWSRRVHGDSPLVLLERIFDDGGEPAGYRHLTGADLLGDDRRAAFEKLPAEFRFKDAKTALCRSDAPTDNFLKECIQLGLIEKTPTRGYRKLAVNVQEVTDTGRATRATPQLVASQQDTALDPSRVLVEQTE